MMVYTAFLGIAKAIDTLKRENNAETGLTGHFPRWFSGDDAAGDVQSRSRGKAPGRPDGFPCGGIPHQDFSGGGHGHDLSAIIGKHGKWDRFSRLSIGAKPLEAAFADLPEGHQSIFSGGQQLIVDPGIEPC